jgi:hypothetical protein
MVANEEEVVGDLGKPEEMQDELRIWIRPNEVPGKDFPKYFGRDECGDAQ